MNEIKIFGLILSLGSLTASLGILSTFFDKAFFSLFSSLFFWLTALLILFLLFKMTRATSKFDFGQLSLFPKFNKNYKKKHFIGFLFFSSLSFLLNGFIAFKAPNFIFGVIIFSGLSFLFINGLGFLFDVLKPYEANFED